MDVDRQEFNWFGNQATTTTTIYLKWFEQREKKTLKKIRGKMCNKTTFWNEFFFIIL